ncbi:uncharacterized protein [Macrobrachium rosenbergii]|uniref:uncharacterized protein isoform X2 n=1 Tax=Macrobrachium rosenbergii TaxID=79674 RepID=UPI0034D7789C
MFARDPWKWTRLLLVYVVVLVSSCKGKYTNNVTDVTSPRWPPNGEMGTEVGTEGGVPEEDDPSAEFLAQHGQRNLVFRQLDAGANTTKFPEVENYSQLHLVPGEEQEKGVGGKRVRKEAPSGNPASKNDARMSASSLSPTEPDGISYTRNLPGTGRPGSGGGKDAMQDDELLEGSTTEEFSGPFTDNPPPSTHFVNEITTEHVPTTDSSLGEEQGETTLLTSAGASNKPALTVLLATPAEFSALKSDEGDTLFMSHIRSEISTLQPATDETPFSELDDSGATTLTKNNEEALASDPSTLPYDTEITTLPFDTEITTEQTTAARPSTRRKSTATTAEASTDTPQSTDPDLNYNNDEDSIESTTLPFASSHTTEQFTVFHTTKTLIPATTTVTVTPVSAQTTKQNTFSASTKESFSTEPTKPLESNLAETQVFDTQTIPITIGAVVALLAILAGATLCFIRRRKKSRNPSGDNNEQFFIPNNHEEEHVNATFVEKGKDTIIGMYSETELETIYHYELQEKVFSSAAAEDGKDGEKPKCLGAAVKKVDPVSGYI